MASKSHPEPIRSTENNEPVPTGKTNGFTLMAAPNSEKYARDVSECTSDTTVAGSDPEKQESAPTQEVPPRDIGGLRWGLVVFAILSSIFLYALDATVVADIQPVIVTEFNSLEKLTWLSVAFLLAATATNLLWGKIYGQFNAKWTYIFCVFFFEVGSAICGVSKVLFNHTL